MSIWLFALEEELQKKKYILFKMCLLHFDISVCGIISELQDPLESLNTVTAAFYSMNTSYLIV